MNLYDTDYGLWLKEQLQSLQQHDWEKLDTPHLIEELEALNRSNKRELYSYLVVTLAHLLKWKFQPENRCGSWRGSISNSRNRITRLFIDQPSLKPYVEEILDEAYIEAKSWAIEETELINIYPTNNPFTIEEILSKEFLPAS